VRWLSTQRITYVTSFTMHHVQLKVWFLTVPHLFTLSHGVVHSTSHIPEDSSNSLASLFAGHPLASIRHSLFFFKNLLRADTGSFGSFAVCIIISHLELIRRFALKSRTYCHQKCACSQMESGRWHWRYTALSPPFTQSPHRTPYQVRARTP